MTKKKIYYNSVPQNPCSSREIFIPIKRYSSNFSEKSAFFTCPAWQHQTHDTFTVYASCKIHLQVTENDSIISNNLSSEELSKYIYLTPNWQEKNFTTLQIVDLFSNFFWTNEKNVWISVSPHPLTSLNNNFYHCGAWFNLSKWSRNVNIGAIIVDRLKPISIERGDPLFNIKFHTENQNDKFELIQKEIPENEIKNTQKRQSFFESGICQGFDYHSIIFDSKEKLKCPFNFLWKK
jgi:hypothetical protein